MQRHADITGGTAAKLKWFAALRPPFCALSTRTHYRCGMRRASAESLSLFDRSPPRMKAMRQSGRGKLETKLSRKEIDAAVAVKRRTGPITRLSLVFVSLYARARGRLQAPPGPADSPSLCVRPCVCVCVCAPLSPPLSSPPFVPTTAVFGRCAAWVRLHQSTTHSPPPPAVHVRFSSSYISQLRPSLSLSLSLSCDCDLGDQTHGRLVRIHLSSLPSPLSLCARLCVCVCG